ncbi:MAG TPA: sugar phosphate isomerase/epimerase [Phycisphaeraceae bacterium]
MSDLAKSLGVQSYCYRGFKDNARVASMVRQCGLDAIEICGVHVNFDDAAAHESVIGVYREAGVRILSIGVQTFTGDAARERRWFQFAQAAGASYISADFAPSNWPEATKVAQGLAEEFNIRLAIHNHGGRHWLGSSQMLKHVLASTGPAIGLCLDTAWCLDSGENPLEWVERFASRLYGLHLKDFTFDRARRPKDVVVGTGNLDLPALSRKLREVGFAGYAVLEYEGDVDNPVPAIQQCVEQVRQVL